MLLDSYSRWVGRATYSSGYSAGVTGWDLALRIRPSCLLDMLVFLKGSAAAQYRVLSDIAVIDRPASAKRFTIVYGLLSLKYQSRLFLRVSLPEGEAVPSVVSLFPGANWMEREAWDLFGVFFAGHPDLRRLLTDYGFSGHPLRKDFPLTGYLEYRYDTGSNRIVGEPVELAQEFRVFFFPASWSTN